MKAKELMIGDWVLMDMNYSEDDPMYARPDYQPYQIWNGEDIDLAEEENCIGDADVYQPMPLTDNILRDNGFEYFHKNFASLSYEHPFALRLDKWPDENGCGGIWTICDIIEIRYVHQLQHALRDCGIDEEIKIRLEED